MTEPVPDISRPASLKGAFAALTPGGTDPGSLMDALKASQREGTAWCRFCERPHPVSVVCPERRDQEPALDPVREPAVPDRVAADRPSMPADPFTPGSMADAATAWFHGMVESGIPVASAERIIGAMFACLVLARGDDE